MKKKKYNSNLNTRYPSLKYIVKITGFFVLFACYNHQIYKVLQKEKLVRLKEDIFIMHCFIIE